MILLDEIEKAHKDVYNALLQVMEEGRLTDGQGRTVDFKNTVLIMTSNLITEPESPTPKTELGDPAPGQDDTEQVPDAQRRREQRQQRREFRDKVKKLKFFKPEFLNRVDELILFDRLTPLEIREIVDINVGRAAQRMQDEHQVELAFTNEAKEQLAFDGYDPELGARPLRQELQDVIDEELVNLVLTSGVEAGDGVSVDYDRTDGYVLSKFVSDLPVEVRKSSVETTVVGHPARDTHPPVPARPHPDDSTGTSPQPLGL